ncbi:MAG: LysM peptidoglycan-binding domain-containing protein [Planctomycetes bacterium]|nr:LysM peptidoglycan-binding domain-containing protein [Planctomycetota bacterium]
MGTKAKVGLLVALALVVVGVVVWDKMTFKKPQETPSIATGDGGAPMDDFSFHTGTATDPNLPPADPLDFSSPGYGAAAIPGSTGAGTPGPEAPGSSTFASTGPNPMLPPVTSYGPPAPPTGIDAPSTGPGTGSPLLPPSYTTRTPRTSMPTVTLEGTTSGTTESLTPPTTGFPETGFVSDPFGETPKPVEATVRTYRVQAGDSLWTIAKHEYGDGSKWEKILEANKEILRDQNSRLMIDMKLKIPAIDSSATPKSGGDDQEFEGKQTYTVQSGDTLSSIAADFYGDANRWKPIFEANGNRISSPTRLRVGMRLEIPEVSASSGGSSDAIPEHESVAGSDASTYTVVAGDSLRAIARRFYNSEKGWEKIFNANKSRVKAPHLLKVGTVLVIPDLASSESNG